MNQFRAGGESLLHRQERSCLSRLLKACDQNALLLADRGLVGFCKNHDYHLC